MNRRHALIGSLGFVFGQSSAIAGVDKERNEVPEAAPVTAGGIRYEAPPWTRLRGLPQNGGYVEAIDTLTGKSLWLLRVFESKQKPGKEEDKQDVFITELKLSADAKRLIVCDELGRKYSILLKTRRVTQLKDH